MTTKISVLVPSVGEVLSAGVAVPIALRGDSWPASVLGENAKDYGVYVIHHGGAIKYVGKADGPSMTFGARTKSWASRRFT